VFKITIMCSFFSSLTETLMICGNSLKIYKSKIDNQLSFEKKRIETLFKWRAIEHEKQNNRCAPSIFSKKEKQAKQQQISLIRRQSLRKSMILSSPSTER